MSTGTRAAARLAAVALGASAVLVTLAPAAQAAVVNNRVTAPAGMIAQSATATCPAGEFLSGAGGGVIGGNGDVTLTDAIPDLPGQSVTVWAHANPGAVPGAYDVVAQAICVPGAPPPGYQVVTMTSPGNAVAVKGQFAACPAGTGLLGLGASLQGGDGQVFYRQIEPNPALSGGTVSAGASGGYLGPWSVTAYAICATPPPGVVGSLRVSTGPNNNTSPKAQAAVCPNNSLVTGVGGAIAIAGTGNVLISGALANQAQDTATSSAVSDGLFLPPWDLTSYAVCYG
ncbi:hypothetical protein [Actinoplanes sp. NPDC049265]|uniref:hypothetical protein n=1 Tax=Actinoplanes sp. NPDC049265 TaxID=3363902 RepID=UPI00371C4DE4